MSNVERKKQLKTIPLFAGSLSIKTTVYIKPQANEAAAVL
jgi:hypothetical protein